MKDLLMEVTTVDGKFGRTLKSMFIHPGRMTRDYILGRRRPYMRPLTVFLLLNVIYFIIQPLANINTFNSTLRAQTQWYYYADWTRARVEQKIASRGLTMEQYEALYNAKSETLAKSLIIVQIPVLAIWMLLVSWRRSFLYDHLITQTHFFAFLLVLNIVATLAIAGLKRWSSASFDLEWPFLALVFVYSTIFLKNAFAIGYVRSILFAAWMLIGMNTALYIYRFLLFILTWAVT